MYSVPSVASRSERVPGGKFDCLNDPFRLTGGLKAVSLTLSLTIQANSRAKSR